MKFGESAFSVAAAKSWNNLPLHVGYADVQWHVHGLSIDTNIDDLG